MKASSRKRQENLLREAIRLELSDESNKDVLRRFIRESIELPQETIARPSIRNNSVLTERVLASRQFQDVLLEHQAILLLSEAEVTVGDILASFDDAVSDMDNSMSEFIQKIVDFAKEYAPENVKNMIEKAESQLKTAQNYKKDAEEIIQWFKTFKELSAKLVEAVKESKRKHPDSVKKMLQYLLSEKKDAATNVFEHVKGLKDMYEKNETFKTCVDKVFDEGFKTMVKELLVRVAKNIPFVGKIVAAAQFTKKVVDIGGKIKDIFSAFKKAKAPPEEKFAAFAQKIIQGPDNPALGAIGKAIQLNDKLEATIDDKIEARFIKSYIQTLKGANPSTPISDLDANKLIGDFIKREQEGVTVAPPTS